MLNFLSRFVDSNERELKRIQPFVDQANELDDEFQALSDEEIRQRMLDVRAEVGEDAARTEPSEEELDAPELGAARASSRKAREKADLERLREVLDGVLPEVFAAGTRDEPSQARHATASTSSCSAPSCSTRARSPR